MDPELWTASALFSPSKARQQQVQAKDWAFVDGWLAKLYAPKAVPIFERNEETLQALLTLANANEAAHLERDLVDKLEQDAYREYQQTAKNDVDTHLYHAITTNITSRGREALKELSTAAVFLDAPCLSSEALAHDIISLTDTKYNLEEQLSRVSTLQQSLEREQIRLERIFSEVQSDSFKPSPDLPEKTNDYLRSTKTTKAKLAEYNERLNTFAAVPRTRPSIDDVANHRAEATTLVSKLEVVTAKLDAFHGLPTDPNLARARVEAAKVELRGLIRKRDNLFETLI
ncbi:hypothetical protein LTR66_009724 [Elasticomyces elasticus]|nr:hypothetical protein LTR66_009724 [Elasticomyces elasticus]